MKKQYTKPQIRYESFELASSIATNCGAEHGTVSFSDADSCGVYTNYDLDGDGKMETIFSAACTINQFNCYHASAEELGVFGS